MAKSKAKTETVTLSSPRGVTVTASKEQADRLQKRGYTTSKPKQGK